jgi:NADH-quinone oxidoreductase subunit E
VTGPAAARAGAGPEGATPDGPTPEGPTPDEPILDEQDRREAAALMARYPLARSAIVPLLYLVQSKVGWVPDRGIREVADLLGLTVAEVHGVATFYTMLKLRPAGRWVVSVCTNPPCAVRGGRALFEHAERTLAREGGVSRDGLFSVEEEECMAACDKAPVLSLNYVYYDRVSEADLDAMVTSLRGGEVPAPPRGEHPGDLRAVSRVLAGLGRAGAERAAEGTGADG